MIVFKKNHAFTHETDPDRPNTMQSDFMELLRDH